MKNEGAIYALQQDLPAMAVFRPAARSRNVQGLYLAGSSAHPVWHRNLDEAHRRFIANLVRQVPELPDRYAV